jgi:protein-S-isoprenylcysteine O-methyltransferase Ste14
VAFLLLAESLLLGSQYIMSWAVVFWLGNNAYFQMVEEPRLRARFGADYEHYYQHVRRWWPRFRPWQPERQTPSPDSL